ncbi:MAG: peptidylprolyl isomerase, partial [Selenomonas sp.]|nr:peptidylprolyl isomerase [Selenomonas sp.]
MKKIMILALALMLLLTGGCLAQADNNGGAKKVANRIAVFETNLGTFEIELFEDKAPKTTKNFIDLTEKGFYDGIIFHRVIDGF